MSGLTFDESDPDVEDRASSLVEIGLTERQADAVALAEVGLDNDQIASVLDVGVSTIRGYLSRGRKIRDESEVPDDPSGLTFEDGPDVLDRAEELADAGLSHREADVKALKDSGLSHREIAEIFGVEKTTIDGYSERLNRKIEKAEKLIATVT